jgi:glycosyltransferase involved in cell wall biosynthesis
LDPGPALHEVFDLQAARHIPDATELYIGWSGFSERGLRRASSLGAVTILERGSAHIECQRDLLIEEYKRWGVPPELPHESVVEKELREYALADYVSVPSSFARQSFLDKGFPAERLLTSSYGVDTTSFRPEAGPGGPFRVIFVGSMTLRKGVQYLLKAFSELRLQNAELWLVGALTPDLEGLFREYDGMFRYFGPVRHSRLPDLFAQCSVFALCSIEEGQALVLTQAMSSGLPVICTPNTGGGDLVDDGVNGFIVPIRDVHALQEKLLLLYERPELCRAMGDNASRRAASDFTWEAYGDRAAATYQRLLEERAS